VQWIFNTDAKPTKLSLSIKSSLSNIDDEYEL
jgi:hypothetical protein